jgi:hypothetical protein
VTIVVEPSEAVGISKRRLERIGPAMQSYVDRGVRLFCSGTPTGNLRFGNQFRSSYLRLFHRGALGCVCSGCFRLVAAIGRRCVTYRARAGRR